MSERGWLALGLVGGLALTAFGVIEREPAPLAPGAIATVNGVSIGADELDRALNALAERRALAPDLADQVLERMIDEELLVQRGLELGLPARDPQLRTGLSRAVIDLVVAEAELAASAVTDRELEAFLADNRAYFAVSPQLRVRAATFASADQARRARAGRGVRAGRPAVGVPNGLVPLPALARAIGDRVASHAAALDIGELSAPLVYGDRWMLVQLEAREAADAPTLDTIRPGVEAEYRRRAGERALREFLAQRRAAARIQVAERRP